MLTVSVLIPTQHYNLVQFLKPNSNSNVESRHSDLLGAELRMGGRAGMGTGR